MDLVSRFDDYKRVFVKTLDVVMTVTWWIERGKWKSFFLRWKFYQIKMKKELNKISISWIWGDLNLLSFMKMNENLKKEFKVN